MHDVLFQVDNLTVEYPNGTLAVSGISFSLLPGECLGIIGPNGAGKSSLANAITGEHAVNAKIAVDRIFFRTESVENATSHRRARLGIGRTFQVASIFQELTVRNHLELSRGADPARRGSWLGRFDSSRLGESTTEVVSILGIEHLLDTTVEKLGQADRKLVEIATVLAAEPRLLLLDEPTAGMGSEEASATTRAIERVRQLRPELGIILIEHNMDIMFRLSDRILVLHQGVQIAEGAPEEVQCDSRVREAYLGYEV